MKNFIIHTCEILRPLLLQYRVELTQHHHESSEPVSQPQLLLQGDSSHQNRSDLQEDDKLSSLKQIQVESIAYKATAEGQTAT